MTTDQINYWKNVETKRANMASEALRARELAELQRSNQAKESETYRSNIAKESENEKQRLANYAINSRNAATNERQAYIQSLVQKNNELATKYNYSVNTGTLAETQRSNAAREKETNRSNVASESIRSGQLSLENRAQAEKERSNRENENLQRRSQNFQLIGNIARSLSPSISTTLKGVIDYVQ